MSKKVDFVIIGAAKSGTTTLYDYLVRHPDIYMPDLKEPCYFDNTMLNGHEPHKGWHKGLDWYHSLFKGSNEGQLLGEASTNYTRYPQVNDTPKRIFEYNRDMKLIYILRDPVARTYSHYVHRCMKELKLEPPFQTAFLEQIKLDPMCIDSSKYALQLSEYLKYFDKESILLLSFSELIKKPDVIVRDVLQFLDIEFQDGLVKTSLISNNSSEFRHTQERKMISEKYKSLPLLGSLMNLITTPRIRSSLYSLLRKLPSNQEIAKTISPPKMSKSDRLFLIDTFKSDTAKLDEEYGFKDESWHSSKEDI